VTDPEGDEQAPSSPEREPASTVGTGSALAIGCVVAVMLLVLIAFAVRWYLGSW
jgi:hypothetical protein